MNKSVQVHFKVIVSLGDHPERRDINYIMSDKGLFSARFEYSVHLNKLKKYIPSCQNCILKIRNDPSFLLSNYNCDKCINKNMMKESELMSFDPPIHYPQYELNDEKQLNKTIEF